MKMRAWFYAATVYNLVCGVSVVVAPNYFAGLLGLGGPSIAPLMQAIGMMVGVYAYGYYLLARDPERYCGMIWVGLAGKTFGPLGYIYSAAMGILPWKFGWMCLLNDVIWWPAFWCFALRHARRPIGS